MRPAPTKIQQPKPGNIPVMYAPTRPKRRKAYELLALTIPALSCVQLSVIGRLYASEVMLILLLPLLLRQNPNPFAKPWVRKTMVMGLLWLAALVATDTVRATRFDDFARGWSRIVVTLLSLIAISLLIETDRRRMVMFAVGLVLGYTLTYIFSPTVEAQAQPWKFGVGIPITLAAALLATWLYSRRFSTGAALTMLAIALLNGYMGHRSQAGVCLMTAVFITVQSRKTTRRSRLSWRHAVLLVILAASGFGCVKLYEYAAGGGLLGETARQLYEWQSEGTLGLFVGGRSGVFAGITAIAESPWLGHGSWVTDSDITLRSSGVLRESGYGTMGQMAVQDNVGMLHSHLVGSWVEAGILGAAFWVWILALDARRLAALYQSKESLTPLIAYFGILLGWDILFSPFGAERRFVTPYYLILLLSFSPMRRRTRLPQMGTTAPNFRDFAARRFIRIRHSAKEPSARLPGRQTTLKSHDGPNIG